MAHNMALYCGAVKLHRADVNMTRAAVSTQHLTRDSFRELFKTIHGKALPKGMIAKLAHAETTRDKVMHGKRVSTSDSRAALADVFDYAEALNKFVQRESGFKPFDDLRGFKGRAQALDKATTRWLLKGLGLALS